MPRKESNPRTEFGRRLRALRLSLNLSQEDMCAALAVCSQSAFSGYERGAQLPSERFVMALARKYDLPAEEWRALAQLGGEETEDERIAQIARLAAEETASRILADERHGYNTASGLLAGLQALSRETGKPAEIDAEAWTWWEDHPGDVEGVLRIVRAHMEH